MAGPAALYAVGGATTVSVAGADVPPDAVVAVVPVGVNAATTSYVPASRAGSVTVTDPFAVVASVAVTVVVPAVTTIVPVGFATPGTDTATRTAASRPAGTDAATGSAVTVGVAFATAAVATLVAVVDV